MGKGQELQTPEQCKAQFKSIFRQLTAKHSFSEAWANFVEISAIAIHQQAYFNPDWMPAELEEHTIPIDDEFRKLEERYMSFVSKYGREGMNLMAQLYGVAEHAVRTFHIDFLGQLYEELELSGGAQRSARGEFFTPETVSTLMATLALGNIEQILEEKGYVTVQEPCVGAGRMVIAVAEQLRQLGHNPSEILYVEAIDVNATFFHMAYFQLSALDLPGRVIWGNTLSRAIQEVRETPQLKLSRYYWEKQPEFKMLQFLKELESDAPKTESKGGQAESTEAERMAEVVNPQPGPTQPLSSAERDGQLKLF